MMPADAAKTTLLSMAHAFSSSVARTKPIHPPSRPVYATSATILSTDPAVSATAMRFITLLINPAQSSLLLSVGSMSIGSVAAAFVREGSSKSTGSVMLALNTLPTTGRPIAASATRDTISLESS